MELEKIKENNSTQDNTQMLFSLIERRKDECRKGYIHPSPYILFLLNGRIKITDNSTLIKKELLSGQLVFLPENKSVNMLALEDVRFVLLRFSRQTFLMRDNEFHICHTASITTCTYPVLDIAPLVSMLLENLFQMRSMLTNPHYQRIKAEEMYEITRYCYSTDQRAWLFQSIIRPEYNLKAFIEANYDRVTTVGQLAKMAGMSETAFRLKFKEIFGETVYVWVMKQLAIRMQVLVESGDDKIKSLMMNLKFTNKSSFIHFCNQWMGGNPSEVIARISNNINSDQ